MIIFCCHIQVKPATLDVTDVIRSAVQTNDVRWVEMTGGHLHEEILVLNS